MSHTDHAVALRVAIIGQKSLSSFAGPLACAQTQSNQPGHKEDDGDDPQNVDGESHPCQDDGDDKKYENESHTATLCPICREGGKVSPAAS
jgi:hypothetical protein